MFENVGTNKIHYTVQPRRINLYMGIEKKWYFMLIAIVYFIFIFDEKSSNGQNNEIKLRWQSPSSVISFICGIVHLRGSIIVIFFGSHFICTYFYLAGMCCISHNSLDEAERKN